MLYNAYANVSKHVTQVLQPIIILECHEPRKHLSTICCCRFSIFSGTTRTLAKDTAAGDTTAGIVVVETGRLYKVHREIEIELEILACNNGASNECDKDN
jgi:hypothetical protein